jgi:hypothetical protein
MASLFLWRRAPRQTAALLTWVIAFVGFYAFYQYSSQDWSFLRFIEPAFPAMLVLGGLGVAQALAHADGGKRARIEWATVALILIFSAATNLLFRLPDARKHDRMFVMAAHWVRENVPPGALMVCRQFSGTLYFQTGHPILRWDIVAEAAAPRYLAAMARGRRARLRGAGCLRTERSTPEADSRTMAEAG